MADDGAGVDDRYKTSSNELQHVPTPDSREPNKCVVVEWLLSKCHCTHNESNRLDLFLSETTSERCLNTKFLAPLDHPPTQAQKTVLWGSIEGSQ